MGFLDDLLGNTAADASKKAAADTYAKQQAATSGITDYGNQYASNFSDLAKGYQPWIQTGQTANDAVQRLLADPSSVSSLPGYQFDLSQGTKAIDNSALSRGNLFSGATGKALVGYGTNLADKTYGDQLSRLLGVSQQGLGAEGSANALTGTGLQGQLGTRQSAYQGGMTSAGTIGQGDIAAANAQAQGSQNLLNTGIKIAGMAAAPFTGGASLGLSGLLGGGGSGGFGGGISGYDTYGGTTFPKVGSGWG